MSLAQKIQLEEICLNAWPALQILHLDGWNIRYSAGLTRRANCVVPILHRHRDLIQKIHICQKIYASHNQNCYFKITPLANPGDLDMILSDRGFEIEAPTNVYEADIEKNQNSSEYLEINTNQKEWAASLCKMKSWNANQSILLSNLLNKIFCKKSLISYQKNGLIHGLALGVLQENHLSILHLMVEEKFRKRNIGSQIVGGLFDWAKKHSCNKAVLSVEKNNEIAINFYKKFGFKEQYEYFFRKI